MSRRKQPRRLTAEERDLWHRVVGHTTPLPERPKLAPKNRPAPPQPPRPLEPSQFQIGEKARDTRPVYNLAPSLSHRLAAQPVGMDHKAFTRMKKGKLSVEGRIDLHGMTLDEAHPRLIQFILSAHGSGKRLVLVITGKGRKKSDIHAIPTRQGVLRHQVPVWLRSSILGPLVLQVSEAHHSHGGAGAFYVYLRRRR